MRRVVTYDMEWRDLAGVALHSFIASWRCVACHYGCAWRGVGAWVCGAGGREGKSERGEGGGMPGWEAGVPHYIYPPLPKKIIIPKRLIVASSQAWFVPKCKNIRG